MSGIPDHLSAEARLQVFRRAAALLASSLDFEETLGHTITACLPALGDFGFFDVVFDDGVVRTARAYENEAIETLLRPTQWVKQERDDMNLCALSSGRSAFHPEIDDAWYQAVAVNDGHLQLLRHLAFRSMISVPMRYGSELIGSLTLFMSSSGRHYDEADLQFAEELAALASPVVANVRLLEMQRRAEQALQKSEERLRLAVEAGRLGIWDWDMTANRVTWSEQVYRLYGMEPGTFGGRVEDFAALVHADDLPDITRRITAAVEDGGVYEAEFRASLPNGQVRWMSTRAKVYRDANGRPVRMIGTTADVTERIALLAAERTARNLAEAARRRQELLASASTVFSQSLRSNDTLRAIATMLVPRMADWCRVDLVDRTGEPHMVLTYHTNQELAQRGSELARRWRAPASMPGSIAWVIEQGKPYLTASITPEHIEALPDPDIAALVREMGLCASLSVPLIARGRTLGALTVLQAESGRAFDKEDLAVYTELGHRAALALDNVRLFSETEEARREAELANRAKDEFLAMLGHELRNPLAPIVTALHLMELRGGDAIAYEHGIISRQVAHMTRLVDDLLDISRITQGKIELDLEIIDIAAVLDRAVEQVKPLLEKHRLDFRLDRPDRPLCVQGDAVRLAQVFGNLLSNAAKFTPPGGRVALTAREEQGYIEVSVSDSGIGIQPALLPTIFDLFVQGPQHIDRQSGGLGLGLSIAKNLVLMHDGRIWAESAGPGQGSVFHVRLPMRAGELSFDSRSNRSAAMVADGRILVVDDNADAGEMLTQLLRLQGYDARRATDGPSALRLVGDFKPDLAILDIGLPGMDGVELAQRLRESEGLSGLSLIALTGYGRQPDRLRTQAAGFEAHLVKPVPPEQLLEAVAALLVAKRA